MNSEGGRIHPIASCPIAGQEPGHRRVEMPASGFSKRPARALRTRRRSASELARFPCESAWPSSRTLRAGDGGQVVEGRSGSCDVHHSIGTIRIASSNETRSRDSARSRKRMSRLRRCAGGAGTTSAQSARAHRSRPGERSACRIYRVAYVENLWPCTSRTSRRRGRGRALQSRLPCGAYRGRLRWGRCVSGRRSCAVGSW